MKSFHNLKIGVKLIGGFLLVALAFGIATTVSFFSLRAINQGLDSMYDDRTLPIERLGQINSSIFHIGQELHKYILIPAPKASTPPPASSETLSATPTPAASLQCSNCHPAAANNPTHTGGVSMSGAASECGRCHANQAGDPLHGSGQTQTSASQATQNSQAAQGSEAAQGTPAPVETSKECNTCHSNQVINTQLTDVETTINQEIEKINGLLGEFRSSDLGEEEKAELQKFEQTWNDQQNIILAVIAQSKGNQAREALHRVVGGDALLGQANLEGDSARLIAINNKLAENARSQGENTYLSATRTLVIAGVLGIGLALFLGTLITLSITRPLAVLVGALQNLSQGDLNRNVSQQVKTAIMERKDELGMAGKSLARTEAYLQEMAGIANQIAGGDLTVSVTPRTSKDELGVAFAQMVGNLKKIVGQLAGLAAQVNTAAEHLALTSHQTGQASEQIAHMLEQVAQGSAEQTHFVSQTASSVSQMSQTIDGVSRGAQSQAEAVRKAADTTSQITNAIQQVTGNAQAVQHGSAGASKSAHAGVQTVQNTIQGMQLIKTKVDVSARRVQEMGQQSEKIEQIVETIEEIASQTNLLALNAAIEAARAGEHGKGFAVVADEVRKLAERAGSSTKEIGLLVRGIQKAVDEAILAMNEGANQVDAGVQDANRSSTALGGILQSTEAVHTEAEQAAAAAQRMATAANRLVEAMSMVSNVVDENTTATREMTHHANAVRKAMEEITRVSEQNYDAVSGVSAATEQMQAQVEEVAESTQALYELAQTLDQVVKEFILE